MSKKVQEYNLTVGEEVTSWCTKCKEMQPHRVKEVTQGRIPRVICLVCNGEHLYRPNPPKSKTKKKKKQEEDNPWKDLISQYDENKAIPYSIDGIYEKDDLIKHHKFGFGIVLELIDSTKMEVAFEDKKRILVYNIQK